MRDHIAYARFVARHKWFVFRARRLTGASIWRALVHDLSKLLPSEWLPYVRAFYAPDGTGRCVETDALALAWNSHQKRNKHHWQAWVLHEDDGDTIALEMPEKYVREMVADWVGAGAALGKFDTSGWYNSNASKMILHPRTRRAVVEIVAWVRVVQGAYEQNLSNDRYRPMTKAVEEYVRNAFTGAI